MNIVEWVDIYPVIIYKKTGKQAGYLYFLHSSLLQ